ncbi:hypothetical protein GCM10011399_22730 [Subtercola lobariae]|uniref:Uncharacterized protein n=2 Tax=Subtercola lobariae TaxID=1588641 RepID=A0A917F000_9MICO|nr:hypothetical protein GCM10011399_22730 [Subtercola lobariae]
MQLKNREERDALLTTGLTWVGLKDAKLSGLEKLSITTASLIAGLRFVVAAKHATPHSFLIYNVPHGETQRVKSFPLER